MVKYWSTRARQLAASAQAADPAPCGSLVPIGTVDDECGIVIGQPSAMAPCSAPPPAPPSPIEVRLPNGVRVAVGPGFSPEILRSVITCLERPC